MKLKKFKEIYERDGFDDIDQPFDDDFEQEDFDDEIEELSQEDVVESLLSTLRKMVRKVADRSYVFLDDDKCINIQFVLNKTERMSNVMKVMNIFKKLESDILIQYESEFDLWETKDGDPLFTAKFYYDEDTESAPTDLEDVPF